MADKDKNVHDRLFKRTFGKPRHARGVFRTLLPAELVARADWSTLALEEGTYVDVGSFNLGIIDLSNNTVRTVSIGGTSVAAAGDIALVTNRYGETVRAVALVP